MPLVLEIGGRRWAVKLSGDGIDLQEATQLFRSGSQIVRAEVLPEPDAIVLQADEFELLEEAREVRDAAERILVPLNAILYLEDPIRKPIAISTVHRRNVDGCWNVTFFAQSASVRIRGAKARALAGSLGAPIPPSPQSVWVQTALDQEDVADLLSYLRETPDWIALYKVYETLDKHIGSRNVSITGWPSKSQISTFTRAAQLHRHSKAWNKKKGITAKDDMIFDDASALVRSMIRAWLEWRSS